jgi:hypothetical protein
VLLLLQCFDGKKRAAVLGTVFEHEACNGHGRGIRERTTIMVSVCIKSNYLSLQFRNSPSQFVGSIGVRNEVHRC